MARKLARPNLRLPRFEICKTGYRDCCWFRIRASNGKIVCHSETYRSRQSCLKGIRAVKRARDIRVIA